jgi:hypothetical protein
LINALDLGGLIDFWGTLDSKFFSRLSAEYLPTQKKLFSSLRRRYVIHALQTGRPEKAREFFELHSDELATDEDWRPWFGIFLVLFFAIMQQVH